MVKNDKKITRDGMKYIGKTIFVHPVQEVELRPECVEQLLHSLARVDDVLHDQHILA